MANHIVNFIRIAEVRKRTSHSHTGVYHQMGAGLLPGSIKIGQKRVAWIEHEIDAIVKARIRGVSDEQVRALVCELEGARAALAAEPANTTASRLGVQ